MVSCGAKAPASPAPTPVPTVCATLGFTTSGGGPSFKVDNYIGAYSFTVASPVTVAGLSVSIGSTGGGNTVLGIYSDNSGTPNLLLTSGVVNNTAASINTVSVSPVVLTVGTYWLAMVNNSNTTNYMKSAGAFSPYFESAYTYNGSLPSTMPTTTTVTGSGADYFLFADINCN